MQCREEGMKTWERKLSSLLRINSASGTQPHTLIYDTISTKPKHMYKLLCTYFEVLSHRFDAEVSGYFFPVAAHSS